MKYTKAVNLWDPAVMQALQQGNLKLQCGQWVRLGDNPNLSRFAYIRPNGHIRAYHYPKAVSQFLSNHSKKKTA